MSRLEDIEREPERFDFFSVLRMLEREAVHQPRIGESATLSGEIVRLSQDPYFAFPTSNLTGFKRKEQAWQVTVRFLGQFGPQGALPMALTEEAYAWLMRRDEAFPRFVDIVSGRFLQLFFRAWADARPIAQHDRPERDRFGAYFGAHIGIASPHLENIDSVADARKRAFAGLLGAKAKSASRLRSFIEGLFQVKVEVDEFVGSHLELAPADCSRLGKAQSTLGSDLMLGASVFSVQDKIKIRIFACDLAQYLDFLPAGRLSRELTDAVIFYVGDEIDWEVELALPMKDVAPMRLAVSDASSNEGEPATDRGKSRPPGLGMLGWTSWLSPNWATTQTYRCDARFNPAEIDRARRAASRDRANREGQYHG